MFLKKFLITTACLGIIINQSYPMDQANPSNEIIDTDNVTEIFPGAAYFTIHTHAYCYQYYIRVGMAIPSTPYHIFPETQCTACSQVSNNELFITYHDKNFSIINSIKITNPTLVTPEILDCIKQPDLAEAVLQESLLLVHLKKRLDPNVRPKATKCITKKSDSSLNISFYDKEDSLIHCAKYPKNDLPVGLEYLKESESCVDLSNLTKIENHKKKEMCTIF